jgi:Holliday junction DNA helicase RuvB
MEDLEATVKKLFANGYKDSILRIIEIEKNPREYVIKSGYDKVDNGRYLKDPKSFLDTFGWKLEDVGLTPNQVRKLIQLGIVKRGYTTKRQKWFRLAVPVEELESIIKRLEQRKNVKIQIPSDIFDCIVGYDEEKWLLKRALEAEKPVHCLLVGPASSGKSVFLLEIARIQGAHYYAAGGTVTKSGLIDKLFEDEPKILIIDEIEKADNKDLSVLLSLMEHGIVTKLVHGQELCLQLETKVFAACNVVNRLPPELRSRFLILRFREYTEDEFIEVSRTVLTMREGVDPTLADYIAHKLVKYTKDVRDAIKVARLANNKQEVDRVVNLMFKKKI